MKLGTMRPMWRIRGPELPLIALLRMVARGDNTLSFADLTEAHIRWAIQTGVGPLLFHGLHSLKEEPRAVDQSPLWLLLRGADLTSQVLTDEHLDAVEELLERCATCIDTGKITLLKGISIGQQHYPKPHLRVMRDIDILVEDTVQPRVEALLQTLGYYQASDNPPDYYTTHHHSMPFVHSETNIWVEVHRGLLALSQPVGKERVFGLDNIKVELRPAKFRGKNVTRLSDELQVIYIAAHWAYSLSVIGGLVALCDMVFLLKNTQMTLRWERILSWLDCPIAAAYLYLMLTYLRRYELIEAPPEVFQELHRRQQTFNPSALRTMHWLIDRYIVAGTPLHVLLSPARFHILWETLLTPGSPTRNLLRVPWNILAPHLYRLARRNRAM